MNFLKVASLSILFLVNVSAFAQVKKAVKNDLIRSGLKGRVKSVTELEYNAQKDTLRWKITYTYNDSGNLKQFETFSPGGVLFSKSVCTYNDSGRLIEQNRYKADGKLFDKTTYVFDDRGNRTEEHNFDASGKEFMKVTMRYDGKGNRINKDSYNEFGALFLKCNYKFEDGYETEAKEYDSHHGLKYVITYEYGDTDSQGNWRTKSIFKNDELSAVTDREISYY